MARKRHNKVAASIGKQKFARVAYAKKKAEEKKNNEAERIAKIQAESDARRERIRLFKECLAVISEQTDWSIYTMSILKWWRLHEKEDLVHMLKHKRKVNAQEKECLAYLYKKLRLEFFAEIGVDEQQNEINQIKLDLVNLHCDMVLTDDISLLTDIEILESKLERMLKELSEEEPGSLLDSAAAIKSMTGIEVNVSTCTVGDFFAYKKMAKNKVESWQETANQEN